MVHRQHIIVIIKCKCVTSPRFSFLFLSVPNITEVNENNGFSLSGFQISPQNVAIVFTIQGTII